MLLVCQTVQEKNSMHLSQVATAFITLYAVVAVASEGEFSNTQMQPEFSTKYKTEKTVPAPKAKETRTAEPKLVTTAQVQTSKKKVTQKVSIVLLNKQSNSSIKRRFSNYEVSFAKKGLSRKLSKQNVESMAHSLHSSYVIYKPYNENNAQRYSYFFLVKK